MLQLLLVSVLVLKDGPGSDDDHLMKLRWYCQVYVREPVRLAHGFLKTSKAD